jgi:tripeptide aminopeptidase
MKRDVVDYFLKLVQIDSESGQEIKMIRYLIQWFKKLGIKYYQDSSGNLIGNIQGQGQPLILCSHMDTVAPGKNIKPVVIDGVIRSSGSTILGADNKATLAAIMVAVEQKMIQLNKRALELLFTIKEEVGDNLQTLPKRLLKGQEILLFDSATPLGTIVLRSPEIINFSIKIYGQSAHASRPDKGKNAIMAMTNLIHLIKPGYHDQLETTINIGLISGGVGINTIPSIGVLKGEIRSYSANLMKKWQKKLQDSISITQSTFGTTIDISFSGYCPGYQHAPNSNLINKLKQVNQSLRLSTKLNRYSGVSDANLLNSYGFTAINLGDGVENPHSNLEQIKVDDLVKLTEIIKLAINKI